MIFKLRTYDPGDFETLYEIDRAYEPEIAFTARAAQSHALQLQCMSTEAEGKLVGFCLAAREAVLGYVITMDVLAEYRRHGIASALLESVEQRLAARNVTEVWLETATETTPQLPSGKGTDIASRASEKTYPGKRDAFTMRKSIGGPR